MGHVIQINHHHMQNSELTGLLTTIGQFTEGLTTPAIACSIKAFKSSLARLEKQVSKDLGESPAAKASRLHCERQAAYASLCYFVKGLCRNPDSALSAIGNRYAAILSVGIDPREANQEAATAVIDAVVNAFRAVEADTVDHLEISIIAKMTDCLADRQKQFIAACEARDQYEGSLEPRTTIRYRNECCESLMILLHHANALAVNDDNKECEDFVHQANGAITMRKQKVKMRENASAKSSDAASETVGAGTVNTVPMAIAVA